MDQHRLGHAVARRYRRTALCASLVVTLSLVLTAPPAQAAPAPPAGLATTLTDPGGAPVLSWQRTPGATSYQVEISADPAFGSITETTGSNGTTNVNYVPAKALPNPAHWRVRARDAEGPSAWTTSTFAPPAAVPSLISPASGTDIVPPESVPVLRWSAVPGASNYVVRVGLDPEFTDPAQYTATTVKSTSFVYTPSTAATYWWQVQAQFSGGLQTEPSESRSFEAVGIADVGRASMSPNHEGNPAGYVEDAIFDWDPVPGAVSYEIQIDTDQDFDTRLLDDKGIVSTRYAAALKNDQYYWRVRPVDAFGVKRDWTPTLTTFRRAWPRQPQLEWPVDQAVADPPLTGPVYFQWTPVRLASKYRLQVASEPNFQPATTSTCETVHTTFVPSARNSNSCFPAPGSVHYWRVQALDGSTAVTDLISSEVHRFQYQSWSVLPPDMLPTDGYSGATPTLSWPPVVGASRYRVVIYNAETSKVVEDEITRAVTYTPRKNLIPKPSEPVTYRWHVIPMSETGSGNGLTPGHQPRFAVTQTGAGAAASPEPVAPADGATAEHFPTLSWTPMDVPVVSDASKPPTYHVYVRPLGQQTVPPAEGTTVQPRFEDLDTNRLAPDTYQWWVEAVAADGAVTAGGMRTFVITPKPAVPGEQSALRGTSLWRAGSPAGERCKLTSCKFPETPIVSWDSNPNVGLYKVTISRDAELTNVVSSTFVEQPALLGTSALPDSQAGQPYYWTVQPCWSRSPEVCRPISHATRNFEKLSNKVEPLAPLSGTVVADDVTLTWKDYVDTNADPAEAAHSDVTTPGRLEASTYRVQVDDNADFSSPIDSVVVEQAQFTSPKKTYPEGPLYWRVQAVDASGNDLPWSTRQELVKRSPVPTLTLPADNGVAAVPEFAWNPLPYAASYDIEVYRNNDTNAGSGNRVVNKNTKHVAYTNGDPLPAAETPYVWRVRRVDATGRKGAWSTWGRFTVAGAQPVIDAPANNAEIEPNGQVFTWHMPAGGVQATSYVLEWRRIGSSSVTRIPTMASAYAPTSPPADGAWEWRVVALDTAGKELGATSKADEPWRQFNIAGTPVATTKPVIEADDGAAVGSTLRALPPTWSQSGVTETWQWLRNNVAIPGQTGTTYVVATDDVGKKISVRVTGSKSGYADGVTVSDPVTGGSGPGDPGGTVPPASTGRPGISGTVQVGGQLSATPGSWSASATPKYAYQWLRNGAPIAGATSSKYRLTPSDAAQAVSVRVTATVSGQSGVADSDPVVVPLMASTTAVTASASPAKAKGNKAKVVVTVKVTVPAGGAPSGSIEIVDRLKKRKAKLVKVVALTTSAKGTVTVKVKLKGRGKHLLLAAYQGDPQTASSSSSVKVKVK